jgi:phosphoglycerol transferase
LLATALLLASFGFATLVFLRPALRIDKPGIAAILALAAAFGLEGRTLLITPNLWHLPLVLAAAALIPAIVLMRAFRSVDMIAFVFHRDFGMQGASLSGLKNEIATAVLCALVFALATSGLAHLWAAESTVLPVAAVALLLANPFVRFGLGRFWSRPAPSVLAERLATPRLAPANEAQSGTDPDLVIIYLEGLDRRFADRATFGDIYRPLARYAEEGISFTKVRQIAGTGWSLAGMVATQSGVPVPPRALHYQSRTEDLSRFMPGTVFLGDVLAARGYRSHYVVGGDIHFGGIASMYTSHQITALTGLTEQAALYPAETFAAAQVGWFLDDQMVFDTARQVQADLLADPAPYALIVETIGPHGPKGTLSRDKTGTGRAGETRDVAKSAACLIEEVDDFLQDLRAAQTAKGRDLRIVLLSDHLNHTIRLPTGGPDYAETNTVIFWGAPRDRGRRVAKPGSMVDIFPTLLQWLGWSDGPAAAGIGRSLLSDPPTLVEEFGVRAIDRMIQSDAAFANLIWDEGACLAERLATA